MRRLILTLTVLPCFLALGCASGAPRRNPDLPDPLSRIETLSRILVLEDSRSLGDGALGSFLHSEDPAIRRRAVLAAGRIGDPLVLPRVVERLKDSEIEIRRIAAFSLGLLGREDAVPALTAALVDVDAATRGRASEALSRIGHAPSGAVIAQAFRAALPRTGGGLLTIRGDDPGRDDDPWVELRLHLFALARLKDGTSLAAALLGPDGSPVVDWWASVWAAMRVPDVRLAPVLVRGATAEDPYIRSLAARGLGALKDPSRLDLLKRLAEDRDPGVVVQALRAVASIGAAEGAALAALHVDSPNPTLRREALLAFAALPQTGRWRARIIDNVGHADPWVRAAAWPALIRSDVEDVGIVLSTIGPDSDWRVRQAVASALAENLGEKAAPFLLPMLADADARVVPGVLSALARARGLDAAPTLKDHALKADMGIRAAAVEGLMTLEAKSGSDFTEAYSRAYDASLVDADIEVRMTLVEAVAKSKSAQTRTLLRRIVGSDPSRAVRQRALSALSEGFAPPEEQSIRMADARRLAAVYEPEANALFSPRVLIVTRHGMIELALDIVDAPLTSASFVRLARAGFFNGLTFHRVVPGFVIQGGDPRGDGYGGPGRTLRCEYNTRPYGRGAVGMALAGKDTGGSQFFIAIEPQPHLDGAYTQFGQVLSGMDVVEKIRPGDVIERIDVFDGRESR
jgi:cyclophilin family peptidyl-prolyl cis-trans isomerase/HEAT repeat protein